MLRHSFDRVPGASLVAALAIGLTLSKAAAACFGYAPEPVELIGALGRQNFLPEPIQDLFVDPVDVEVEGVPPPGAAGAAAPIAAGPPPKDTATGTPGPPAATTPVPPPSAAATPAAAAGPPAKEAATADPLAPTAPPPLPPPAVAAAVPALEVIGPPIPPELLAPDPVLLRARPVAKPPPPEAVWVLALPKPICIRIEAGDLINQAEKNIRQVQLIVDKELEPGLRPLLKKRVVVRGQLFHATSRRHYLPVLFNVEDLRPPEWVQDTTQHQRPPPQ